MSRNSSKKKHRRGERTDGPTDRRPDRPTDRQLIASKLIVYNIYIYTYIYIHVLQLWYVHAARKLYMFRNIKLYILYAYLVDMVRVGVITACNVEANIPYALRR